MAIALAGAAVILLLGQFLLLPWLLRQRIVTTLNEAGVKGVHFRVARATLWGSRLSDVVAGEESVLTIDQVGLDYRLSDLWKGRIKTIRISGAKLHLGVRDGEIDLRPLQSLRPRLAPSRNSSSVSLPVNRIELASSKLILQAMRETVEVPIGGSVAQQSDGRVSISLQLDEERAFVMGATLEGSKLTFAGGGDTGAAGSR